MTYLLPQKTFYADSVFPLPGGPSNTDPLGVLTLNLLCTFLY